MRKRRTPLCLLIPILASSVVASATVPPEERQALIDLFNATNGRHWNRAHRWLWPQGTECEWWGVTCTESGGNVMWLTLDWNNLKGSLPASIGDFGKLEWLSMAGNELEGEIPPEIGKLVNLYHLDLSGNIFRSGIQPKIGDLFNLKELDLYSAAFTGSIPPSIGDLSALQLLDLSVNRLTGSIPPELSHLANVREINLYHNQLTGEIPPALAQTPNLEVLILTANQISGSIPAELGGMPHLATLRLSFNLLTGSIPAELGSLPSLWWLDLRVNRLSGPIPPELGQSPSLEWIILDSNRLTGEIPRELGNLSSLRALALDANQLTGPIPPDLGGLANLSWLSLGFNHLSGGIPAELGNVPNLNDLRIQSNMLRGSLPPEMARLTELDNSNGLDLSRNALWTDDPDLGDFISSKHGHWGDWRATQTVAPTDVVLAAVGNRTAWLAWSSVDDAAGEGGYEVLWSESGVASWHLAGFTSSKSVVTVPVTGLDPSTTYDFVVETFTNPNDDNENRVVSDESTIVTASTGPGGCATPVITRAGTGSLTLGVEGTYSSYEWSTGEATETITVDPTEPEWYWVTVTWPGPCEEAAATLVMPGHIFTSGFEEGGTYSWSAAVGVWR